MAGFSFGATPAAATTTTTSSFQLGSSAAGTGSTLGTSGFTLGAPKTTGLSLVGNNPVTQASTGFGLGAATTTASTGFGFGTAAKTTASTGFGFPTQATTTTAAGAGGFSLGSGLGTAATSTTGGLTFGKPAGGLTLGGGTTTTASGFSLGSALAPKTTATGLTLGTATTGGLGLGGLTATTSTSGGLSIGGAGGIFGTAATTQASQGLGGVDPKTSTASSGSTAASGKPGENKAIKEIELPKEIVVTVESFKKHVKEEKQVREDIARMSSKPLYKVQEEVATLKQLLSVVSNGLQRNAATIEKLKIESAQELKNAEIAQRTKDTPPGLQYENTAPTSYFHHLVEDFEVRMILYRQQIEEMENHLNALNQANPFTPQELSMCLRRLHETFVAMAAQLQGVHEAVKTQKEQYLNYRRVFHGDPSNIFESRKKSTEKTSQRGALSVGPTPFSGMSNMAAAAMATALNRGQQPSGAPPAVGMSGALGTNTLGSNPLGTTQLGQTTFGTGLGSTGFGTTGFGTQGLTAGGTSTFGFGNPSVSAVKPLGLGASTGGGSLFGSTATTASGTTSLFGNTTNLSASTPAFGSGSSTAPVLGVSTTGQPFQLQKPPAGSKRGKK